MTHRAIAKARLNLKHAGTRTDREELRQNLTARLKNELEQLKEAKAGVRQDYRRQLERWRTEDIPETM